MLGLPDGRVIIGGYFTQVDGTTRNYFARLGSNGGLDTSFNSGSGANGLVKCVTLLPSGKVLLGGDFSQIDGTARNDISEVDTSGNVDTTFSPFSTAAGTIFSIVVQTDGKVLCGGNFNFFARLNMDGSLDTAFAPSLTGALESIAIQPDGKIIIGGTFTAVNGVDVNNIARLNVDGSLDASFNPGTGTDADIECVALQADGKILIAGVFTTVNGIARSHIARLNADGSLDASFSASVGSSGVAAMAIQSDGKIIMGGGFTQVDGATRNGIARLNADPPVITSVTAVSSQIEQPFSYQITATFGPVSYASTSLPPGLSLDSATGLISGTPTTSGTFSTTLSAINSSGTGTAVLTFTITALPSAPTITSAITATAQTGVPFSFAVTATGSPTGFAAVGLPPGLMIDPATGLISGTPAQAGTFSVSLSATNAGGAGTGSLTITVTVPPANVSAVNILSPPTNIAIVLGETIDLEVAVEAVNGTLATVEFDVTDASGNKTYLGNSTAPRDHKTWNPTALGDFTLSAVATDITGATARSEIPIHVISGSHPPTSELLSGLNGKSFAAGSSLPLVALAVDAAGNPLTNVQFYLDGVLVPGATSATAAAGRAGTHRQDAAASPYSKASAKLGNLIGDALLTMTGTDSRGVTSVSNPATIHTTAATATFTCAIVSPDGSGTFAPGASVTATASAQETGGSVAQVEYFLNDQSVGKETTSPFTLAFALPATAGQYALTAIATDTQGVSAASAPVILSVVGTPVVTIAPASASVEEGAKGKIVFQRTGNTGTPLTVRYKVAGDAEAGTDYKQLSGTATIPVGATQVKIKLKTIDNTTVDGIRVAKIKLLPATDGSYVLGTVTVAKVKILDND